MAPQRKTIDKIYHATITQTTWLSSGGQPHHNDPTKTLRLKRLKHIVSFGVLEAKDRPFTNANSIYEKLKIGLPPI
jgi:hypothetical protein